MKEKLNLCSPWSMVGFPVGEKMRRRISIPHKMESSLFGFLQYPTFSLGVCNLPVAWAIKPFNLQLNPTHILFKYINLSIKTQEIKKDQHVFQILTSMTTWSFTSLEEKKKFYFLQGIIPFLSVSQSVKLTDLCALCTERTGFALNQFGLEPRF